jgi:hypothetical protein
MALLKLGNLILVLLYTLEVFDYFLNWEYSDWIIASA